MEPRQWPLLRGLVVPRFWELLTSGRVVQHGKLEALGDGRLGVLGSYAAQAWTAGSSGGFRPVSTCGLCGWRKRTRAQDVKRPGK